MRSQLTPSDGARLLLLAAKAAGTLRTLGDLPGHEFHGNQWTDLPTGDGDTTSLESNPMYGFFNRESAKWTRDSDVEARQNAFDAAQRDAPALGRQLRDAYFGKDLPKEVSVYRVGPIRDGVNSFFPRLSQAQAYQKRFGLDKVERVTFDPKRLVPTGAGSGELFGHSDDVVKRERLTTAASVQRPVHAVADAHEPKIDVAVRYAFARGRRALGKPPSANRAAAAVKAALKKVLKPTLLAALKAGGDVALPTVRAASFRAAKVPPKPTLVMRFDVTNQDAVDWADQHAAELIDGISETTRQDVNDAVAAALESGDAAGGYEDILAAVGDAARAALIARTEAMTAANEGQRQGWAQAADAGLLPEDATVTWIATEDACPECADLDGATRDLNGEYDDPDAGDGPPLHPNCRCTEGITS